MLNPDRCYGLIQEFNHKMEQFCFLLLDLSVSELFNLTGLIRLYVSVVTCDVRGLKATDRTDRQTDSNTSLISQTLLHFNFTQI